MLALNYGRFLYFNQCLFVTLKEPFDNPVGCHIVLYHVQEDFEHPVKQENYIGSIGGFDAGPIVIPDFAIHAPSQQLYVPIQDIDDVYSSIEEIVATHGVLAQNMREGRKYEPTALVPVVR